MRLEPSGRPSRRPCTDQTGATSRCATPTSAAATGLQEAPATPLRHLPPLATMEAPSFWARALPLGEPKKLLGLGFIVAVAVIWVGASFVVQGIEEHGAHPAVLTFVANSLFAVYVPVYFANLRWRRRRAAHARNSAGATRHVQETGALVAPGPRSDEGDSLALAAPRGGGLTPEDSGKGASPPASIPLRQLFHAALVCERAPWAA